MQHPIAPDRSDRLVSVFRAYKDAAALAVIRFTCGPQDWVLLKVMPRAELGAGTIR